MKIIKCGQCEVEKKESEYYSFKGKINGKSCKDCRKLALKKEYKLKRERQKINVSEKTCFGCDVEKTVDKFDINKSKPDGYTARCKDCINLVRRGRYSKLSKEDIKLKNIKQREYQRNYRRIRRREDISFRLRCNISTAIYQTIRKTSEKSKGGRTFDHLPYTPRQLKEHIESQFEDWMTWDNHGEWHIDHIYPQSKLPYDSLEHPNFQKCWSLANLKPISAIENFKKGNYLLCTR